MLTARQSGEAAKTDLAPGRRETYGTTLADAIPEQIITLPSPSLWPLVLAMGVAVFLASLLTGFYLAMGVGILIGLVAVTGWHWPSKELTA
jgi:cytochrome c oxidase subunit 1